MVVAVVLGAGVAVNIVVQRQLRDEVQAADQAPAQSIALETSVKLRNAPDSLAALARVRAVLRRSQQSA